MTEGDRAGGVLAGRFRLEDAVGRGGMATVYRAVDVASGQRCAVKLLHGTSPQDALRFEREAELLAELAHPAVVRHVAHGRAPSGEPWLAMEWLEGTDLSQRLAERGVSPAEAIALARRVADGLAVAHARGVVHRDIKPANVFLPGDEAARAKILDFGIAHLGGSATLTRTGTLLGTPAYMAPEQARGRRDVDARADVFSLGAVLYECLAQRPAFPGEQAMAVLAKVLFEDPLLEVVAERVDARLADLLARMLAKDPAARPRDGAAVAGELRAIDVLEGPLASAAPAAPGALSTTEKRLHCVLLVGAISSERDETVSTGGDTAEAVSLLGPGEGGASPAPSVDLDALRARVSHFGGRLERLLDGSMAVTAVGSGAPTDQVAQAARCALAVRELLPGAPMALAAGRGVAGEGWPVGEAIDRAAVLLRDARRGHAVVIVDDITAALLDARFQVVADGGAGERSPPALALLGERGLGEGARTLLGRPTPCVGRERELRVLDSIYEECVEESVPRAVIVVGHPGVGKSRLRQELLQRLATRAPAPEVWMARGDPVSAGAPFGSMAQLLRGALHLEGLDHASEKRAAILAQARLIAEAPAEQRRIAEFLGELVGVPFPGEDSVQLRAARADARLMGDQMRRAWLDLVAAATRARPLLLVVEDAHWGDLPTLRLIDAALQSTGETPLMAVAFARPEVSEVFPKLWAERSAAILGLGELTRRACERLARQVLVEVDDSTLAGILDRAQGNAFYLEELIRAVAQGDGDRLPDTVLAMVQSRLDALEPEARQVLRAASVFGQAFWAAGVRRLLGETVREAELSDWLAELTQRELLTRGAGSRFPGEAEHTFRHALLREAAYAALTEGDRRLGHRLAAEWLVEAGEDEALLLAEHFERGGQPQRSVSLYRRAAEQALEGGDLAAAVERAERGVRCGAEGAELGALRLVQSEAHGWLAEPGRCVARASEAMGLLPARGPRWWYAVAQVAEGSRRTNDAVTLRGLTEVLAHPPEGGSALAPWVRAASLGMAGLQTTGDFDRAGLLLGVLGQAEAQLGDDPESRAWIDHARSWRAMYAGALDECLRLDRRCVESFTAVGDLRNAALQRSSVAYDLLRLGANAEAEAELREVLPLVTRLGLSTVIAVAHHYLGLAVMRRGDHAEAVELEQRALRGFIDQTNVRMTGGTRIYLAQIHAAAGELTRAESEARAALETLRAAPPLQVQALATLADVLRARGEAAESLQAALHAKELRLRLGEAEEGEAHAELALAEAMAAAGDVRAAPVLAAARRRLVERADAIADAALRESFLRGVPEHARTLALAQSWGVAGEAGA